MLDSYWSTTATPACIYPKLQGDIHTDVCIIGGGYLGLSAALHLAQNGVQVSLLEACEPGWGASGRNGGQIIPGFKSERSQLIEKLGEEGGGRLFQWSNNFTGDTLSLIKQYDIDCQASQPGWIQPAHCSRSLRDYEKRAQEWQEFGVNAHIADADETKNMLGTDWYVGAYVDPRGGRLNPLSYARGLAQTARTLGAKIFSNSLATSVHQNGNGWYTQTSNAKILSKQVLICTNAYTDANKPLIDNLQKSIIPIPSYMVATEPLDQTTRERILPGGQTAADLKLLTNHFRMESDGRFLFGGRGALKNTSNHKSYNNLGNKMYELFPALKDVKFEYTWSGYVAITTDGLPHLHRPADGLWAALGCNGRGVGMCTSAGKIIAQLMQNTRSESDSPIPLSSVQKVPFHTLHLAGASLAISWKNYQDNLVRWRDKPLIN